MLENGIHSASVVLLSAIGIPGIGLTRVPPDSKIHSGKESTRHFFASSRQRSRAYVQAENLQPASRLRTQGSSPNVVYCSNISSPDTLLSTPSMNSSTILLHAAIADWQSSNSPCL